MGTLHEFKPSQQQSPREVHLHPVFKNLLPGFFSRLATALSISIWSIGFSHEEVLCILKSADPDVYTEGNFPEMRRAMWRRVFQSWAVNFEHARGGFWARQGPDAVIGDD